MRYLLILCILFLAGCEKQSCNCQQYLDRVNDKTLSVHERQMAWQQYQKATSYCEEH